MKISPHRLGLGCIQGLSKKVVSWACFRGAMILQLSIFQGADRSTTAYTAVGEEQMYRKLHGNFGEKKQDV